MSKLFTRALFFNGRSNDDLTEKGQLSMSPNMSRSGWKRGAILQERFIPLGLLSIHTSLTTFVMQLSRRSAKVKQHPSAVLVVLSSELLKIVLCLLWIFVQPRLQELMRSRHSRSPSRQSLLSEKHSELDIDSTTPQQTWENLSNYIFSAEGCVMIIPSILYVLQNMLQISAIPHTSTVAYQSICQFKIVATAVLSIMILGSKIGKRQWICLIILTLGVIDLLVVQGRASSRDVMTPTTSKFVPAVQDWDVNPFVRKSTGRFASYSNFNKAITKLPTTRVAVISVILASILGSFSGVYLESRLKRGNLIRNKNTSLAMKNACLATYSILTLSMMVLIELACKGGTTSQVRLTSFDNWTLLFIVLRAGGGLLVAASLQYADSISKSESFSAYDVTIETTHSSLYRRLCRLLGYHNDISTRDLLQWSSIDIYT
jgi:drug/metabolite transporter (DMT)-like permease